MSAPRRDPEPQLRPDLLAVLAHELRSPIGAILGWEELLSEGIHGTVDGPARDALGRMRAAGKQLLQLVGGMSDLAQGSADAFIDADAVDCRALVTDSVDALRLDAEARSTTLDLDAPSGLPTLRLDAERTARALQLALGAAIKNTPDGQIRVVAHGDDRSLVIDICGGRIGSGRDEPDTDAMRPSGAGLRIAMARRALEPVGGSVLLHSESRGCTLQLVVPALPD